MHPGSATERDHAEKRGRSISGEESAFLDDLVARIATLRAEFQKYVAIKVARIRLSLWKGLVAVVSVTLAVVFAIACVVTAVVFVFSGLAGLLGDATSKPYLGSLLSGVFGLVLVASALAAVRGILIKRAFRDHDPRSCSEHGHDHAP